MIRRRRVARKSKPRRRMFGRRKSAPRRSLHAPKTFVSSFKYQDVDADPYGTHIDNYQKNQLFVNLNQVPIFPQLSALYRQFAITSVKFEYRPVSTVAVASLPASQIVVAENKDADQALPVKNVLSEDNCKKYVSTRAWKMFVKKPRPALYQQDGLGNAIKVIGNAKQLHWLSTDQSADMNLEHLCGQMCVQDITGATGSTRQGELWCKIYIAAKEQSLN